MGGQPETESLRTARGQGPTMIPSNHTSLQHASGGSVSTDGDFGQTTRIDNEDDSGIGIVSMADDHVNQVEKVCQELETSSKGVINICKREGFVSEKQFYRLINSSEELRQRYTRAKAEQSERMVEEMLDIADDSGSDWIEGEDGTKRLNSEHVQRAKLKIDTRKWIASKLKAKKYGDKVTNEHTGPNGGPIINKIERIIVKSESNAESDT